MQDPGWGPNTPPTPPSFELTNEAPSGLKIRITCSTQHHRGGENEFRSKEDSGVGKTGHKIKIKVEFN